MSKPVDETTLNPREAIAQFLAQQLRGIQLLRILASHDHWLVPAPINKSLTTRIQHMARQAFKAVDGAGFARVDFFLRRDDSALLINEINTCPGLTDVSGFPKMWAASGLPFPRVIDRLIELARARHQDKARNQTSL